MDRVGEEEHMRMSRRKRNATCQDIELVVIVAMFILSGENKGVSETV